MRKPTFCICENNDADQLRGNHEADQRLCFRYTDSIIPILSKSEISSLQPSSVAECLFSHDMAHFVNICSLGFPYMLLVHVCRRSKCLLSSITGKLKRVLQLTKRRLPADLSLSFSFHFVLGHFRDYMYTIDISFTNT